MTIQNIIDFYFSQYKTLVIKVEMFNSIKGKYNTYTKEEFLKFVDGWNNEKVITINFTTHYTNYARGNCTKRETPILYICYKSNDIK